MNTEPKPLTSSSVRKLALSLMFEAPGSWKSRRDCYPDHVATVRREEDDLVLHLDPSTERPDRVVVSVDVPDSHRCLVVWADPAKSPGVTYHKILRELRECGYELEVTT